MSLASADSCYLGDDGGGGGGGGVLGLFEDPVFFTLLLNAAHLAYNHINL